MSSSDEGAAKREREPRERPVGSRSAVTAVAGLVLAASLVPVPAGPSPTAGGALPVWVGVTTPFHLIGYAALAALASRATAGPVRTTAGAVAVGVAVATAFGFGVELVQGPIPWRSFAWSDAAVNAVGSAVGAGIFGTRRTVRRAGAESDATDG